MTAPNTKPDSLDEIVDGFSVHRPKGQAKGTLARKSLKKKLAAYVRAETEKAVQAALLELKEEMKQHTVPEGYDLITRNYLNNSIDFKVAALESKNDIGAARQLGQQPGEPTKRRYL